MINICFLDAETMGGISLAPLSLLGENFIFPHNSPEHTAFRIKNCQVAVTNKVVIGRREMEENPDLKLICVAATGMNNIDLIAAKDLGIEVRNVKGYSTDSVAQVTFGILFELVMRTNYFDKFVKSGSYSKSPHFSHFGHEFGLIAGKTFGIIGLGEIGRKVAEIAQVFGCKVVYYSSSGKNLNQPFESLSLDELLQCADFVSIHASLNTTTENLLAYEKLCLMKSTAYLLNVGRGGIVNEADLARALDENRIAGAAMDVFTKEPIDPFNPLLSINNNEKLLLTPHIAWAAKESREKLLTGICNNIQDFFTRENTSANLRV